MNEIIVNNQYNIGHICTRMQCDAGNGEKTAMKFYSPMLELTTCTFFDLEEKSNKFANALIQTGVVKGDIVFTFLPKVPEMFFCFLGILKCQAVAGSLFSNMGEEAILDRVGDSMASVVITKKNFLKKFQTIKSKLPFLKYIIVIDVDDHLSAEILSYKKLMAEASPVYTTPVTGPDVPSVLHYTSGSTGKPKGVQHVHKSVLYQIKTGREILNLKENDIFWCTADHGWVTGTTYGIITPWALGITQIHYGGAYNQEHWFTLLQSGITVWYTAPTALRMLMKENDKFFGNFDLGRLKHIYSVGEPLNPEIVKWGRKVLKKDIFDTWFQTETGAIMITNRPGLEIRPGSMGKPVAGVEAAIIAENGTPAPVSEQGFLCLKPGWDSMFITYLNNESVYAAKFKNGYYYTGDSAYKDEDGYFWFLGRTDDIINTAGHLVSPFEIESALLELPEISEAAAIGAYDEILFEKVVTFICLKKVFSPDQDLELKIRLYISNKLSTVATPQEIIFTDTIPKNKSGKIMRRLLKAQYEGKEPGDISTLEI